MIQILGGSKGLGSELLKILSAQNNVESKSRFNGFDFSKKEHWVRYLENLKQDKPEKIIYCVGGGPFGNFHQIGYHAHLWAWKINFEFPSYLLHEILSAPDNWPQLKQICFIGSAIAENKIDLKAASYASAKHALKNLILTVQQESQSELDIRLFSPGYMNTTLLPQNAWPRQSVGLVKEPVEVAHILVQWLENKNFFNKHLVYE